MEDILQVATKQRIYDIGVIASDLKIDEEKVSTAAGMDYHDYLSQKKSFNCRCIGRVDHSWS